MRNYFNRLDSVLTFIFLSLICAFISACSYSSFSLIGIHDEIDNSLPRVRNIKVLPDVSTIAFEWTLPEDLKLVGGYVLYRLKGQKWEKIEIIKNSISTHTYDKKLKPETAYTYAIATLGKDGRVSPKSVRLSVTTSYINPIDFIYASKNYARSVKIIWSPSPNPIIKRYIIERESKNNKFVKIGVTDNRFDVEYFDTNLDDGTSYNYKVVGEGYDGSLSRVSEVATGTTKTLPAPVVSINATNDKPRAIWINWAESEDKEVEGYNVLSSEIPNGNYKKIAFVRGNSYIDKILEDGATRYYKITAIDNARLESKPSQGATIGSTLPPPQSPIIVQNTIKDKSAYISWSKVNDKRVVGYVVYRKAGYFKNADRFMIDNNHFIDKEMQEGVKYSYSVTSIDENNIESVPSKSIELSLLPPPKEELKAITTTTTTYVNSKGEVVDKKTNTNSKIIESQRLESSTNSKSHTKEHIKEKSNAPSSK